MRFRVLLSAILFIAVFGSGFSIVCVPGQENLYSCVFDNGDNFVCSSVASDLSGCCSGWVDVVPDGRTFDASACGGTVQDLHIGTILDSPSCSYSSRIKSLSVKIHIPGLSDSDEEVNFYVPTDDPANGYAECLPGYLDCIAGDVSSNMGCETNCNECETDKDCPTIESADVVYKCDKDSHCNKCVLVGKDGRIVLFQSSGALNGEDYTFVLYNIVSGDNEKPYVDIYNKDGLIVESMLENGDYFSIGDKMYRISFSSYTGNRYIRVYRVNFIQRLTYNIFPVCGNQVCETCESPDNCLHYPPESCFSCPIDCPAISDDDLSAYFDQYGYRYSIVDVENDVDLACKIKTLDNKAVCDPLCRVHPYIDKNGCLFNKYGNSLPVDENGRVINSDSLHTEEFSFNGQTLTGVYDNDGNFLGEESQLSNHFMTSSGNGECLADCECLSGHCSKENPNSVGSKEYGHCCPPGFEWEDSDPVADLCEDGKLKNRDAYLVDMNNNGISDLTEGLNGEGIKVTSVVCPPGYTLGSCSEGIDPACAYNYPDGTYAKIEPNGVFQCRKVDNVLPPTVVQMRCLIHSHAAAYGECEDQHWYCTDGCCDDEWIKGAAAKCSTFRRMYCVTDRDDECADLENFRTWALDTEPLMFSITYEEFCTTPEYVCAKPSFVNSTGGDGGFINYFGCVEGSMQNDNEWLPPMPMSVGQYCSLFGNDIDHIYNFSSRYHLPMVDHDSIEEYYREMWNYESCKEIFGSAVPNCDDFDWYKGGDLEFYDYIYQVDISVHHYYFPKEIDSRSILPLDENGNPSSLVYTSFGDFVKFISNINAASEGGITYKYVHYPYESAYSKEWCEGFWDAFKDEVGEEFDYAAFRDSLQYVGKGSCDSCPLKDDPELLNRDFSINYGGKEIPFYRVRVSGLLPKDSTYMFSNAVYSCLFYAQSYKDEYYSGGYPDMFISGNDNDMLISCHPDECDQNSGLIK